MICLAHKELNKLGKEIFDTIDPVDKNLADCVKEKVLKPGVSGFDKVEDF